MYAVCRIQKLKSSGEMTSTELHTNRQRETPNADPTKFNERLLGSPLIPNTPTLAEEVFSCIGDNGGRKIRSDAVLCVELLLSASPEFFRPDEQGAAGKWDAAQLEIWKQQNHRWLVETFGDRLLRIELHLDETSPTFMPTSCRLTNRASSTARAFLVVARS